MPADAPTILATSGGIRDGRRTRWELSALTASAAAYFVESDGGKAAEVRVDTRLL
jgi:hypothetical protein